MEEKFYRPEIAFLWHFCTSKSRFSPFKNCFWRKEWRKNSEKNLRPSSHSDLPIELVHVTIGASTGLKLRYLWRFRVLKSRFSNFKNRFWRREWKKNSGRNSRCFFYLNLSIELLKFEFYALGGPELRGSWLQNCQNHVFPAKHLVPGERYERKILKKIPKAPLSCINRFCRFQKFSLKSSQMRK